MVLKNTKLQKNEWEGIIKSLNYKTFFINGSFLSKAEAIQKIQNHKDSEIDLFHFEPISRV